MHLSASVLAAALLSSALTIDSSARDVPGAISAMASGPGPDASPHVPDILISKRGRSLAPRSPHDGSNTDGLIQPNGNGSDPNPNQPSDHGNNPDPNQGGGGSGLAGVGAGLQNNTNIHPPPPPPQPQGNTPPGPSGNGQLPGLTGSANNPSTVVNEQGGAENGPNTDDGGDHPDDDTEPSPDQPEEDEEIQTDLNTDGEEDHTDDEAESPPDQPEEDEEEHFGDVEGDGHDALKEGDIDDDTSVEDEEHNSHDLSNEGEENVPPPGDQNTSPGPGGITKPALARTTEGSWTEMNNPLQKTKPIPLNQNQGVQQGQTQTGSLAPGIAESTMTANSSAPAVYTQPAATPGSSVPGQSSSPATGIGSSLSQTSQGQPEEHNQQLLEQAAKGVAAQTSQGSGLVGAHGSHQTEPSPGLDITGDPATHQNNFPVKNGTETPRETEPKSPLPGVDSVQAVTPGSGTGVLPSSEDTTPEPTAEIPDKNEENVEDTVQSPGRKVHSESGKKTDGKAGQKAGKDKIAAPGVTSDPNTPSTPSFPSASSNSSATGDLSPSVILAAGEPSGPAASTTSGINSTTKAGTQTGPGASAPAVKSNITDTPVVPTTSANKAEAAATDLPALPVSNSTDVSAGTAKLPDTTSKLPETTTLSRVPKSPIKSGNANATGLREPPFPVPTSAKPTHDNSTAASISTRPLAGTNTTGLAKPTHAVQPIATPISVSALVSAKANVTFPRSFVIVDGAAYFPGLVKGSGYFRVVVDVAASLVFLIERCQQDERNTVVVKAKGEYRYLECSGAECNAVVRVDVCGTVRVAPCAGQCDASVFCQGAGQCVDAGHRPAVPRAPAAPAAANSTTKGTTKVTTNISVSALAQVAVTPEGGVTGLIRAVAEVQASQGRGTVSTLAKAVPASPGVPALPISGSRPAPSAGAEGAPASGSGTKPSSDSDKGPAAHDKTAASSHEQAPASAAKGGVSPEPGSRAAPAGAPAQPNSAAADNAASRPDNPPTSPYQAPATPVKATTGPASPSNGGVSPSKPQDQRPGNALTAAASRHMVGAHIVGALAVLVLMA